jgi:hypothetical protein
VAVLGGANFSYFVPLFTTRDLARQFLATSKLSGLTLVALTTSGVLAAVLDGWERMGARYVAIDMQFPPGQDEPLGRFFLSRALIDGPAPLPAS